MKYVFLCLSFFFFQVSFSQNDSVLNYGQNLIYENKLNEAIDYFETQLVESENAEQKIKLLIGLSDIYKLKLDYTKTNDYLLKAYEAIELSGNNELKFLYHLKMMEFYRKRGLFLEAINHQEKAEKLLQNNTINDKYLSDYYGRRAAIFGEHFGIFDSIFKYANKSLIIAEKNDFKDNIFYAKLEIASVYYRKGEFKRALTQFEDLLVYAKENDLVQNQADVYINMSNALIKDNQLEEALKVSLEALEFTKKNDLLYNEIVISINVYETYKKLGNHEKAYDYLLDRIILTELYNEKLHDKFLFELEEKYKLSEKENQITINQLELQNKNEVIDSGRTKLYITISLFIAAIAVTFLIAYFLKKSKEKNKQLKILSEENEFLLSEANHRINNNLQLVVILISDQLKKAKDENRFQLKSILSKVDAISTLHKHLYKNRDKRKINLANYLNDISHSFSDILKENNIKTNFKIDSVEISSDYAMYLGLLLTELSINSIKHAFENQEYKQINFLLSQTDNTLYFNYSDNGTAISNLEIKPKLIDKLCRQLKIDYTINTENGLSFSFEKEIKNA